MADVIVRLPVGGEDDVLLYTITNVPEDYLKCVHNLGL